MRAVADSSVLISLSSIGLLSLLGQRYSEGVMVPLAVWYNVVEQGEGRPGAEAVRACTWIQVVSPANEALVLDLRAHLDPGEAEAIALALEQRAPILMDEREGRRRAAHLGLSVLGTLGVLVWARRQGFIPSLADTLVVWQQQGHFRVSDALTRLALESVGEA